MKKHFSNFILTLICLLIFSFSKPTVNDYRDSYCGDYTCKCVFTHLHQDHVTLLYNTSTAVVKVQKNAIDSMIDIVTPERTFKVKVRLGLFYFSRGEGKFDGDKLYLKYRPSHGPQTWKYFGKK